MPLPMNAPLLATQTVANSGRSPRRVEFCQQDAVDQLEHPV